MYTVTAKLINALTTSGGKDSEGKQYPPTCKIQLLGDMPMKDGQVKKQLIDLTVPVEWYNRLTNKIEQVVKLPISFFVNDQGTLVLFFPKGAQLPSEKT